MIKADRLTKRFGAFTAVDALSLEVADGEVLALLGPNGAGKTTTVRMLSSILRPTSGQAVVNGYDTVEQATQVRHVVGLLTEVPGLYTRMCALDYLDFFGRLQYVPHGQRRTRSEELLRRFDLWEDCRRPIGTYSKGMRQKLALTRALIHDPRVLFLDEPTSAMDPASAKTVRDYIVELRRQDRAVIICTHNLAEAEALADRIAIIQRGRIVAHGTIEELKRQLLGYRRFELRLAGPASSVLPMLDGCVQVDRVGDCWLTYSTPHPEAANPQVLRRIVEGGVDVVTLGEVERGLETIYLSIVQKETEHGHSGA